MTAYIIPGLKPYYPDLHTIAEVCGVKYSDLLTKSRKKEVIMPKQAACYILRNYKNMTFSKIGSILNLTHASVIYNVKTFETDLQINRSRVAMVLGLVEKYRNNLPLT
ncbi:hypothetical protein LLG07_01180 [bacterium]|nr:hypothetical protein [bacterium]